ncbi:hypothetical protein Trydic_g12611 [Trypoxylus dichotomus]
MGAWFAYCGTKLESDNLFAIVFGRISATQKSFCGSLRSDIDVIVDETCMHHYMPELNEQSSVSQWVLPGKPTSKKAKIIPSAGKVMAAGTVFSEGKIIAAIADIVFHFWPDFAKSSCQSQRIAIWEKILVKGRNHR